MTVRELLNDLRPYSEHCLKGKIYVYRGKFGANFEFDANDEILLDAEIVEYELNYGKLYIRIE